MVGGGWLLLDVVVWCWVLVVACAVVWLCVLRVVGGCLVVVGCCWRLLCEVAHCRVLVGMCLLSSIGWRAVVVCVCGCRWRCYGQLLVVVVCVRASGWRALVVCSLVVAR